MLDTEKLVLLRLQKEFFYILECRNNRNRGFSHIQDVRLVFQELCVSDLK